MVTILQTTQPHIAPTRDQPRLGLNDLADFAQFLEAEMRARLPAPASVSSEDAEAGMAGRPVAEEEGAPDEQRRPGSGFDGRKPHLQEHAAPDYADAVPEARRQYGDESLADESPPLAVRVSGAAWRANAAQAESSHAARVDLQTGLDDDPASQMPAHVLAAAEPVSGPEAMPVTPDASRLQIAQMPFATGARFAGQRVVPGMQEAQPYGRPSMDAGLRNGATVVTTDPVAPDDSLPARVSKPAVQWLEQMEKGSHSLPADRADPRMARQHPGQGGGARPEQTASGTAPAGFSFAGISGTTKAAESDGAERPARSRLTGADQIAAQAPLNTPPLRAEGGAVPGGSPTAQVTTAPVSTQIAEVVRQTDQRVVQIQLAPAELGRVRITLAASDVGMQVIIATDRVETLDLLRRNASDLIRELAELGYEGLSLSFGSDGQRPEAKQQPRDQLARHSVSADMPEPVSPAHAPGGNPEAGMDLRM